MRHPDLPENAPIQAVRSQVFQLGMQGWYEVDAPPPPKPPKDETSGDKPAGESETPRRRSAKKSED
jgi:hypothetical protein